MIIHCQHLMLCLFLVKNIVMRSSIVLGILSISGLFLLESCGTETGNLNKKTVFRYNESAGITSLDPVYASDQANIWAVNQLFNGLVQLDDALKVAPCVAKSWTVSQDGLNYRFILRDDVRFHDSEVFIGGKGRKVTASDVVFSFNRLVSPEAASPGSWIFNLVSREGEMQGFNAINDTTLDIHLREAFPPFLGLLTMQYCSVVPREAIDKYGKDFRKRPVGTGPFTFKLWKEGVKLVMTRNQRYFETEQGNALPYLDAIAITFIADKQAAFLEFVKGNLDFISGLHPTYKDELLSNSGELNAKYSNRINLEKCSYLNTEYLGIRINSPANQDNPLNNKLIRQAISCGFDRNKMIRYMRNNIGIPGTKGFVPAGLPFFDQQSVKGYEYNPLLSRQLLEDAGYPNGLGLPAITLTTNASYLDLCKFIQSQLNELGFNIRIDVTPPATLRDMVAHSKVSFFRGSWIADYPDPENYLSLFYSDNLSPGGPNTTHYSNAEFDRLYRSVISERNDSVRGSIYVKMDNMVMEEAPVIVLYYDQVLRFTQKSISGIRCNPLNLLQLKRVRKVS